MMMIMMMRMSMMISDEILPVGSNRELMLSQNVVVLGKSHVLVCDQYQCS